MCSVSFHKVSNERNLGRQINPFSGGVKLFPYVPYSTSFLLGCLWWLEEWHKLAGITCWKARILVSQMGRSWLKGAPKKWQLSGDCLATHESWLGSDWLEVKEGEIAHYLGAAGHKNLDCWSGEQEDGLGCVGGGGHPIDICISLVDKPHILVFTTLCDSFVIPARTENGTGKSILTQLTGSGKCATYYW